MGDYWIGYGEDYGPAMPIVAFQMQTYLNSTPQIYFADGDTVRIASPSSFAGTPVVSIKDPSGSLIIDQENMSNGSGEYYYDFLLDGYPSGWYNTTIMDGNMRPFSIPYLFYQGNVWLDNYTDYSGSPFSARTELNLSEPSSVARNRQPVDIHINTSLGATPSSLRLTYLDSGSRLLEIPSQFYNFTYSSTTHIAVHPQLRYTA